MTTADSTHSMFAATTDDGRMTAVLYAAGACMVSGGLLAISFPPYGYGFCAWFSLVPILIVLPRVEVKNAWLLGILVGLVYYRVGLNWAFSLSGPHAGGAILVLSVWLGFAFRMIRLLMDRYGTRAMLWAAPVCFAGQEIIRSEGLPRLRFGYLSLGYSQVDFDFVAQIASIVGVYGLTFLIAAVNAGIVMTIIGRKRRDRVAAVPAILGLITLGMLTRPPMNQSESIPVAIVQSEECGAEKYIAYAAVAAMDESNPAIIVLPEHAIDFAGPIRLLSQIAAENDAYICVGAHTDTKTKGSCNYDNVAMLIGPDGRIVGEQAKTVPVPFFQDGNPAICQEVFTSKWGKTGLCVCYDADFTDVTRGLADKDAGILLIPVMNPEKWHHDQREQQAIMARMRSIETRKWSVRSASSGTSQIIDANGKVIADRRQSQGEGLLFGDVKYCYNRTPFVVGGYRFSQGIGWGYLVLIGTMTISLWRKKKTEERIEK